MPLKYQQQFKDQVPTVVLYRAVEGGLIYMRLFISRPPRDTNHTTKSYCWRRMSIYVRVKAIYGS